jgi:hypothetical protein
VRHTSAAQSLMRTVEAVEKLISGASISLAAMIDDVFAR